jgi:acyl-homoserine lactone acylase PvdQ
VCSEEREVVVPRFRTPLATGGGAVIAIAAVLGLAEVASGHRQLPANVPHRVAATTAAHATARAAAAPKDDAIIGRDIMPSGEYGGYPTPPNANDQAKLYNALTPLFGHVTAKEIDKDFIPMTLGADIVGPSTQEDVPRVGVTIFRDKYNIPHVIGRTRDDVTWGAGWVMAEDRSILLNQARGDAYLAAINAPGYSAISLIGEGATFAPSQQTTDYVAQQTRSLVAAGKEGHAVLHDLTVYLNGMNAYRQEYNPAYPAFTLTDIYAFNALKDQFVGEGGGQQAANGEFLSSLEQTLGKKKGYAVWNDLREADDPEAPVSVPGTVQFQAPPKNDSGNVMLDPNSLSTTANFVLKEQRTVKHYASNALLIAGARSSTGHPIMVAGPQIGYFYPGLTMEEALQGPGIDQIGATTAPFPGYIFIGRSEDQAWSLTSAGLDQITTYVERLCNGSQTMYMYDGSCRPMEQFNAGTVTQYSGATSQVSFEMTVNGPVIGYATVKGQPVALTQKRASTGKDVDDLLFYYELAHGHVHNVKQFFAAAAKTPQTFNSLYVNDKDIGVYTSGLVPIQPTNVDQDLPVNGDGTEEWRGFVPAKDHPQGVNPPSGEIVNWNNRTEAGYEAPDDNWTLGAVQRVSLLLKNLGTGSDLTPADVVSAMNKAATQDVDDVTLEPLLAQVLSKVKAPSSRDAKMLSLLNLWYKNGSSLLDKTDSSGMGNVTSPGAAILLTAWPDLADAWASAVLGPNLTAQFNSLVADDNPPPDGQYTGWYVYMNKDLRTILGEPVQGKFAVKYCGAGNIKRCASLLWAALNTAGNTLEAQQGPNPANWRVSAVPQRITFTPGLLSYTMRYTNRPSGIQQVISFGGHTPGDQ